MNPSPATWPRQSSATPQGWRWPAANRSVIAGSQWPTLQRLYQIAGANPSLDLNFARTKTLQDAITGRNLVTFTRAQATSDGSTYVAADGSIKTAAANEPRFNHDPITGESLGLLVEEARTNLLLNSGTLSTQSVTVTAVAHTLSFTGTGTITLTGTSTAGPLVGTGTGEANRVSLTFTPTAGSLTLTVSGTVANAQLEIGAFLTSYIPTTTATVTRSADVASITGSNFSSWFRSDAGTLFVDGAQPSVTLTTVGFVGINDAANTNRFEIRQGRTSPTITFSGTSVTFVNASPPPGTPLPNVFYKQAAAFGGSSHANYVFNGSQTSTTTLSSVNANRLMLGIRDGQASPTGGAGLTISRLTYWPTRLPNATLQQLTQ
jgi:hypothetical protein